MSSELYEQEKQAKLEENLRDMELEHKLRTDFEFFVEYNLDDLLNAADSAVAVSNICRKYGWHLDADELEELIDSIL